jgi:hypothetical protein
VDVNSHLPEYNLETHVLSLVFSPIRVTTKEARRTTKKSRCACAAARFLDHLPVSMLYSQVS